MKPTERFSDRADEYAKGRPTYPSAAIDALFLGLGDPQTLSVADLGAGTGISSRLLAERGARVYAIEPNAAMRDRAGAQLHITWIDATAEATGLGDASCDLAVAFQAFHWFRPDEALGEMQRIVRSGGRIALVYNERSNENAFTRDYDALVVRYAVDRTEHVRAAGRSAFEDRIGTSALETFAFANVQRLTHDGLIARAASTSYLPKTGERAAALHAELDALVRRHAIAGVVEMTMQTRVLAASHK